jgi:hypothetical protein
MGIHRIPTEFPHSTELELRKLCQTQTDFGRPFTLELLRGLPTSREVLRPSEPHLSLSTLLELNLEALWRPNSHFLPGGVGGIYRGVKSVHWAKVGLGGPLVRLAGHLGWSGGQVLW